MIHSSVDRGTAARTSATSSATSGSANAGRLPSPGPPPDRRAANRGREPRRDHGHRRASSRPPWRSFGAGVRRRFPPDGPQPGCRGKAQPQQHLEPFVQRQQRELVVVAVVVGQPARGLQRQRRQLVLFRKVSAQRDDIGADLRIGWVQAVDQRVAEAVARNKLWVQLAQSSVVAAHGPGDPVEVRRDPNQLRERIDVAEQVVRQRLDASVTVRSRAKIDRAVLREVDLAGAPMWADELAGMVGAGERNRVGAAVANPAVTASKPSSTKSQA